MEQPVPPGTEYNYDLPPPPGVDSDGSKGYYGNSEGSRDYNKQRDKDRSRRRERSRNNDYRHERGDGDRNRHFEDYDGYYDEGYGDSRDYYAEDLHGATEPLERPYSSRRESRGNYSDRGEEFGERGHRDRYRDRERDRYRDRDRYHDRERDRVRSRERDREHSKDRVRDRDWDRERDWREEIPNTTIMVKGLSNHVSEADIRNEVMRYGLEPKDIRLMRKKDTGNGTSRGFAFVEFPLLSEAVRWKELTQGVVILDGHNRSTLHYSIPKDAIGTERGLICKADWTCSKCNVNNFRRRDLCFKCNSPREETEIGRLGGEGYEEISSTATNTLLFRNLDILTTEERVLSMLGQLTVLPIKSLKVAKDPLTNTSRGFAFVELHTTSESTQLYDLLLSMEGNFYVDGRQVTVSYARRSLTTMNSVASANAASVALAAAQWTNQSSDYPSENQYHQQKNNTNTGSSVKEAVASIVPNEAQALGTEMVVVDGVRYRKYQSPDISSYQYDQSSGYYYDSSTGLYYDSNSQYYYNSHTQQYLYWEGEKQTYLPASVPTSMSRTTAAPIAKKLASTTPAVLTASAQPATTSSAPPVIEQAAVLKLNKENEVIQEKGKDKDKVVKGDKVKIAKKIAKEMEKWAKTLNQKKDNYKVTAPSNVGLMLPPSTTVIPQSATVDLAFTVLQKKPNVAESAPLFEIVKKKEKEKEKDVEVKGKAVELLPLVAAYGDGSDSESEGDPDEGTKAFDIMRAEEVKLTDWPKLACLLCKRQFPTKETLMKHQQLSDLHKQNLDILRLTTLTPMQFQELAKKEKEAGYRDRAKERREKFGQPDQPPPNRLKTKFLKQLEDKTLVVPETPNKDGISSDNIGNKMLKAMGWSEGQGLGKTGQGMSGIIEVQQRVKCAGLGMKGSSYGSGAGDSYKDAVKKAMQARYKDLS